MTSTPRWVHDSSTYQLRILQVSYVALRESERFNANYLLLEYPGYGIAEGRPTEETVNAMALNAYNFVVGRLRVPPARVVISGRSIGTGPACHLAAELTKIDRPPAALILHSPHSSIRDLTMDLVGVASNFVLNRFENWRALRVISCPVLFLHADKDTVIDPQHSAQMHEMRRGLGLPSEVFTQRSTARLTRDHNNFDYEQDVVEPVRAFLERHLPPGKSHSLSLDAVSAAEQAPAVYQKYEHSKSTLADTLMWLLCPCAFTAEACCAACSTSSALVGNKLGCTRRDYHYSSRMDRGLKTFPIELHAPPTPAATTKQGKKTRPAIEAEAEAAVNPMQQEEGRRSEDGDTEVISIDMTGGGGAWESPWRRAGRDPTSLSSVSPTGGGSDGEQAAERSTNPLVQFQIM